MEHLLRDIKDIGASGTLTDKIQTQQKSLEVKRYYNEGLLMRVFYTGA